MMRQTFTKFLESVVQTKRQNITHLERMKPVEFVLFAKELLGQAAGKLKDVKISLKVDGFGARFGRDRDGKFFFETSRSGPIQSPGAFSEFNRRRGVSDETMMARAKHYDELYDALKSSPLWYHLPIDSKVICEILYNPMADLVDGGLKFVSVKYDRERLGNVMTIAPFYVVRASTGERLPDSDDILQAMEGLSNKDVKIIDPKLGDMDIDVSATLKPMSLFDDEVIAILQSRSRADKARRAEYEAVVQEVKSSLAKRILSAEVEGKDKLGKEIEGFVLDIGGKSYKVTTQDFKDSKKRT
jgi:hypothetical protein